MKKGLLALTSLLLIPAAIGLALASSRAVAGEKPLLLRFGPAEVIEIRTLGTVSAYRAIVDGQVVDERKLAQARTDRFFMHVNRGHPHDILFNFDDAEHGLLNPQFPGVQNQCSTSKQTLPPAQTVDLASGWTSIYCLTVTDPCAGTSHALDIQIK